MRTSPGLIVRVRALREAGAVKRCHTIPIHGSYDIAQHCWNVVTLLYLLHPDPSPSLVKAALWHDIGERYTGDLPAPVKWKDAELAKRHRALESAAERAMGFEVTLSKAEEAWLKSLDCLELYLFCEDQRAFGNQHVKRCREELRRWFAENGGWIPMPVLNLVTDYEWDRTTENLS